jgi:hypothetical protein
LYRYKAVAVPWRHGDVMLLNNLQVMHSRQSFVNGVEPRRVLASLAGNPREGKGSNGRGMGLGHQSEAAMMIKSKSRAASVTITAPRSAGAMAGRMKMLSNTGRGGFSTRGVVRSALVPAPRIARLAFASRSSF